MSLIVVEANMWTMCEFNDSNGKGFGHIWWTDKFVYFNSIDKCHTLFNVSGSRTFLSPEPMSPVESRVTLKVKNSGCHPDM